MDLVSFDTKGEFEMFREIMDRGESLTQSCLLNIRVGFFGEIYGAEQRVTDSHISDIR